MDTLVFDVETVNFFTDPEVGWNNFEALKISVVSVYSYLEDKYYCFDEHELGALKELMRKARLIVGFSINRYDVPVLNLAFKRVVGDELNLFSLERLDLLDEIELVTGRRISLGLLAEANLGEGKSGQASEAGALYREGKIEELKAYCTKDVELTKRLYDLYKTQKYFLIPDRDTDEKKRVDFIKNAALF